MISLLALLRAGASVAAFGAAAAGGHDVHAAGAGAGPAGGDAAAAAAAAAGDPELAAGSVRATPIGPNAVVGRWTAPPTAVPTGGTTDGPLFGNGELAVIFGGQTGGFSFNFGSNSFVREIGASGGVAAMPGGVDVYAPVFSNATFSAAQVIANGTVTSAFTKSGVGTLRTSSFVRPMHRGVSLMVSKITYAADAGGPRSIELGVAARAGPLGHADDVLIWGPCSATPSILVANRSNGEDWQDIYRGVRPTEAAFGSRITRVAIAVSVFTASGGNAFANVSVPGAGMDAGRSANGTVQLSTGETLMLLTAVVNNRDINWADPVAAAMDALTAAQADGLSATVTEAKAANSAAWREYWAKSSVSLPHSLVTERYYWASLYLLKLAAGGSSPPGLYCELQYECQLCFEFIENAEIMEHCP